jgi:hypothetical protein
MTAQRWSGPNKKGPANAGPFVISIDWNYGRRLRCWPRPIFLANSERAAA